MRGVLRNQATRLGHELRLKLSSHLHREDLYVLSETSSSDSWVDGLGRAREAGHHQVAAGGFVT